MALGQKIHLACERLNISTPVLALNRDWSWRSSRTFGERFRLAIRRDIRELLLVVDAGDCLIGIRESALLVDDSGRRLLANLDDVIAGCIICTQNLANTLLTNLQTDRCGNLQMNMIFEMVCKIQSVKSAQHCGFFQLVVTEPLGQCACIQTGWRCESSHRHC